MKDSGDKSGKVKGAGDKSGDVKSAGDKSGEVKGAFTDVIDLIHFLYF